MTTKNDIYREYSILCIRIYNYSKPADRKLGKVFSWHTFFIEIVIIEFIEYRYVVFTEFFVVRIVKMDWVRYFVFL